MNAQALFVMVAIVGYGTCRFLEAFVRFALRRGRVYVAWVDADSGRVRFAWEKPRGNEVHRRTDGASRAYLLDARARLAMPRGNAYIIHERHGWNLLVPADADTVNADRKLSNLVIADPASYWHAITRNEARDVLNANTDDKGWIERVAPLALIGLLIVMIGVGVIVYKVWDVGVGASTPGPGTGFYVPPGGGP